MEEQMYVSKIARQFEQWLSPLIVSGDVIAADLIVIMTNCIARLRSELTLEEMHEWVHKALVAAENRLQSGTAFIDPETGETVNMLLAEERAEIGRNEANIPDSVPEEWTE